MSSAPRDRGVRIRCPGCDSSLRLKGTVRPGKQIRCPKCQHAIVVSARPRKSEHAKTPPQSPPNATKSPAPSLKKSEEDTWLDDLGSLGASPGGAEAVGQLPPVVGAPKPRKKTRPIDSRESREVAARRQAPGMSLLEMFGPLACSICGGLLAGAVGAALWAGLAYWTNYEFGFAAWGLGALVGAGVWIGGGGDSDGGSLLGILAVVIAFASIWLGKAGAIYAVLVNLDKIPAEAGPLIVSYVCVITVPFTMGIMDIVWFGLAGASAFKIGSGLFSGD